MIIDVNAYVGHWPFRQLRHNTVQGLLRRMDAHGIDRAVVSSINGIFYKNPHASNEELDRQTRRHRDRLVPFATLKPNYPGWEEDLRRCAEDMGFRGIRLYPQYHGYALTDSDSLDLIDAVTEKAWPVQVPMRVVDRRQRHEWDLARDLEPEEFEAAISARPQTGWMVLEGLGLDELRLPAEARYLMELSRMTSVLQRTVQAMMTSAGSQRVAFGTGMPFKEPRPAMLKLEHLDVSEADRERVAWRNAAEMIGLEDVAG